MDEQKRFPIGPGPEDKKPGLGSLLGKLLTRAGRAGRSSREGVEDRPFKFDATQFMVDKFKEEGVQPEILGEGFDGNTPMLIIRTPNSGMISISLEANNGSGWNLTRTSSPEVSVENDPIPAVLAVPTDIN